MFLVSVSVAPRAVSVLGVDTAVDAALGCERVEEGKCE